MRKTFKRRKGKTTAFNPGHDDVSKAVEEFLNKGGKIKVIDDVTDYYDDFLNHKESTPPADDFLLGR